MTPEFEEKEYEQPLNQQLLFGSPHLWTPGQVFEQHFGVDSALEALNLPLWQLMGHSRPLAGVFLNHFNWGFVWRKARAVRVLPSFKVNLLLQVKRSDYFNTKAAKPRNVGLEFPFWRFNITPHQQIILNKIENKLNKRAVVSYAAPAFHDLEDLYFHTENVSLVDNSTFVRPSLLNGHSKWAYDRPGGVGFGCSEPEGFEQPSLLERINQAVREQADNVGTGDENEARANLRALSTTLRELDVDRDSLHGRRFSIYERMLEVLDIGEDTTPVQDFASVLSFTYVFNLSWLVIA